MITKSGLSENIVVLFAPKVKSVVLPIIQKVKIQSEKIHFDKTLRIRSLTHLDFPTLAPLNSLQTPTPNLTRSADTMDPYESSDEEKNPDDETNSSEDFPRVHTPPTFHFPYTAAKFTSVCTC